MNNKNLKPIEKLTPFTKMIMTIGTLPSSFYASMSYYESMVWLYEYLKNQVIPTVNNNAEAVEELQTAFTTLQNWIEHYFDNLDLQEEVNIKLDEMAEDGSLTNLIKGYVDPIYQAYENEINTAFEGLSSTTANRLLAQDVDIANFKGTINQQVAQIDNKVNNATSGSPKGVYATVSDLETADPDHDYIYVVTATGNWYYYDTTLTTWTSGGTYQGTAIPDDDMKRLNTAYSEVLTTEVTDLSDYYHYYINSTSPYSENTGDNARTSEYIICQGYNKITYKTSLSSGGFELVFYDRNKTILPTISIIGDSANTEKTVSVPNTAYYVRLCVYGTNYITTSYIKLYLENSNVLKINTNTTNITNNKDNIKINQNLLNDLSSLKVTKIYSNINGYIRYSDGSFQEDPLSVNDKRTDYILVKGYNKIEYFTNIATSGAELAFFNENKEYLQSVSIQGHASRILNRVDVPNTAYYVILSQYSANMESYIILYNDNVNYKTALLNKNILILGDSITASANISVNEDLETSSYEWHTGKTLIKYPRLFNNNFLPKEIRCYALNGATYSKLSDYDNPLSSLIDQAIISINDKTNPNNVFNQNSFTPDIIILAAGTNQHSVGTYDTAMSKTVYQDDGYTINVSSTLAALDQTKEIEAARYVLMKLKNEWPMAQIYVVLPIQRMSRNQLTNSMNIELEKLAIRYGAVVINGCDNGIVQEGNVYQGEGVTLEDGLHPNQNGQYLMTRQILKSIESNYFDYSIFS